MRYYRRYLLFLLGLALAGSIVSAEGQRPNGNGLKPLALGKITSTQTVVLTASLKTTTIPDPTSALASSTQTLVLATPADRVQLKTSHVTLSATQPRDLPEAIKILRGKDPEPRTAAILYLCKIKDDARINEAFLKLLAAGQPDLPQRQQVIDYLVARNVLQVSPHLVAMLKSSDSKVRLFALSHMSRLFSGQGLSEVERLLRKDPDKAVRAKAAMTAIWMRGFKK